MEMVLSRKIDAISNPIDTRNAHSGMSWTGTVLFDPEESVRFDFNLVLIFRLLGRNTGMEYSSGSFPLQCCSQFDQVGRTQRLSPALLIGSDQDQVLVTERLHCESRSR